MVDQGSAAGEVGRDIAQVFFGGDDLDAHDRLQKHRAGLLDGLAESVACGKAKGQLVRVDIVGRTVDQSDLHVDQGVAGSSAGLRFLAEASLDRRQEVGWDHARL